MKYLFLFLIASSLVAAASITYEGTTIPISSYNIEKNTITIERISDSFSTELYKEATSGETHIALQLEDKTVMTFGGVTFTGITTTVNEELPKETITIVYSQRMDANNTSCAQDICTYMQDNMGVTAGSTASFIPFSNAVVNVQTHDLKTVSTITIKDSKVESMTCCMESLKPTHTLSVKGKSTLADVQDATDQVKVLSEKLDSKELTLTATSFGGKISLFFKKLLLGFA